MIFQVFYDKVAATGISFEILFSLGGDILNHMLFINLENIIAM